MRVRTWLAVAAAATIPAVSFGQIHTFPNFPLDGLQEVPPNASPASGTGTVILNMNTMMVSWDVTFTGLIGAFTASHFHAPAPPGVNAGVVLAITGSLSGNRLMGSAPITATFAANMLAGLTYINIHTTQFPGGEIRGQVVPTPGALSLLGIAGLAAVRRRR